MLDDFTGGFSIIQGPKPKVIYACNVRHAIRNIVRVFSNERTLKIYTLWLEGRTIRGIAKELGITPKSVRYHMHKVKMIFPNMRPWV